VLVEFEVELVAFEVVFEVVFEKVVLLVALVVLACNARAFNCVNLVTFLGTSSKSIVAIDSKAPLKEAVLRALEVERTIITNTKEVTFIDY
jgi:hypothetical protein